MTGKPIPSNSTHPSLGTLLWRALRLRCPACGQRALFRTWFAMNDPCAHCGRRFHRAPGYLLGSIYFNYGVTSLLVVIVYFSLYFGTNLSGQPLLILLGIFALVFPIWFFRYARALWIAFDEKFDPWPNEDEVRKMRP
ncbi:MAG: DUF983 domain-containing protein [Pirellulales bacterium]